MCRLQDPESSNECHRICGLKCLPQETAEAIALDLQADILSDCNEDSVDENNGGEDSGDSGCEDESRVRGCREATSVRRGGRRVQHIGG